ncbi:dihydroneopterin aldolase [Chlamydiales bacterium]|nr:dihydroneopterin aldolase [Chlamydiales bacterium]
MSVDVQLKPITTVGGLIFASDGTCLLVKSPKWSHLWSVPGGKVEGGETLSQAFTREVKEETGLALIKVSFAKVQESIFSEQFHEKRHFVMHDFIAQLAPGVAKESVQLNHEHEDYQWVLPEEALKMPIQLEVRELINWHLEHNFQVIGVNDLKIRCIIGVLPEEREAEQELYLSIACRPKKSLKPLADRLDETVNYIAFKEIAERVSTNNYQLIETYAYDLCHALLKELPIAMVDLTVRKPSAIAESGGAYVQVKLCGH